MIQKIILTSNNPTKIDSLMKDSRTIAGIQDNTFASNFQLNENYETTDNALIIHSNNKQETTMFQTKKTQTNYTSNIGVNDSMVYSGSSKIDQYPSGIEDHHDNINKLTLERNNDFVIRNHENIIEEVNREYIDIQ